MSFEDLLELNKEVVKKCRMASNIRDMKQSQKYVKGQTVKFKARGGEILEGVIIRVNQKGLSLLVDGRKWRVSYYYIV